MIIKDYKSLYPHTVWIARVNGTDDINELGDKFDFCKREDGYPIDTDIETVKNEIYDDSFTCHAECRIVEGDNKTGILLIIYGDLNIDAITHESVHIANYICDVCGITTQSIIEGNEAYAYLCGWVASCIDNYIKETKDAEKKK